MKKIRKIGLFSVLLVMLAFVVLATPLASCNKAETREDAEEKQIASFKKSIAKDTLNVYEIGGIILDVKKMGKEEYLPDEYITIIFTGVAMQRNVTFAKNDTVTVKYGDNQLMEGWKIALPFLKKNSSGVLLVTYNKGYGKERVGVVEPYSTLKFTFSVQ
ncbi:MAG: FKBP-type peptidyl-prolyl cis-trans isomerase [Bacteroidales bacterium]|nr:FKBP-type peptidyl-prolyl cis-trans isomerase [Bacteroidales bacterium]